MAQQQPIIEEEPVIEEFPVEEFPVENPQQQSFLQQVRSYIDPFATTPKVIQQGAENLKAAPWRRALPFPTPDWAIDLTTSLMNPIDLALMLGTGGEGVIPKLTRGIQKIAGGALAARGATRLPEEPLAGGLEIAGGLLGMHGASPKIANKVEQTIPKVEQKIVEPIVEAPITKEIVETPITKLNKAVEEIKPFRKQQDIINTQERMERLAKLRQVETTGMQGHYERKGALAGEFNKVQFEPLSTKINTDELNQLVDTVQANTKLLDFEKVRATDGLEKLYNGQIPQPNEIKLLIDTFGEGMSKPLIKLAAKQRGMIGKALDFNRSILTAFDFSAPGRQGLPLITRKQYWTSFDDMFRSWGSKDFYESLVKSIDEHPNFVRKVDEAGITHPSLADRAKLSITDTLTEREEMFRAPLENSIPLLKRSERAYSGFLNKLRADTFNAMVDSARKLGKNPDMDDALLRQIGDFINDATGRGSLGRFERSAKVLNETFFAPRLIASRVNMYKKVFDPRFYTETDPLVRKETLRSLLAVVGVGSLMGEMARMAGASVSNDYTSADFRKIKIGNTRIDPFGGFQQYAIPVAKMLSGISTSTISGKKTNIWEGDYGKSTPWDLIQNLFASKLAPLPSFVYSMLRTKEFDGQPFDVQQAIINRTVPIMAQDLKDLYQEDPSLLPLGIPAAFGMGVQTYSR